jgi:probable F420-dependent oxidoreductase
VDYGIALPHFTAGSSRETTEAAAEAAVRLGWHSAWVTDHLLVNRGSQHEYGRIFEALVTLTWIGARHAELKLGTSVIVVPQRNAVVLAKELATLDSLSSGRLIAGVGVGWNEPEYRNLGAADRFRQRGAYLDETIALWRHLWSGSKEPFAGRFHPLDDFFFEPLPAQGADLPIWVGGRAEVALRRAGRLADGYHSSQLGPDAYAQRLPAVLEAAREADRPAPHLSARLRVTYVGRPTTGYALAGTPEEMAAEVRRFAALGVRLLVLAFGRADADHVVSGMERFDREVRPLVDAAS